MIRNIFIFTASLMLLTSTFAMHEARSEAKHVIALQGGETLYIFEDGLMAKESKFGTPVYINAGETVQAMDGRKIEDVYKRQAEGLRQQSVAHLAFEAYQASLTVVKDNQNEVLATRQFMVQETQLHYNGMLKSVWDLLAEVNNQSQASIDAINAQRDALMAETDLQWVLQGGSPASFVSLGGASNSAPAAGLTAYHVAAQTGLSLQVTERVMIWLLKYHFICEIDN